MPADLLPFTDLNVEARGILFQRGVEQTFQPGEVLWQRGAHATGVHFVLEGEVKIVRAGDGRQHTIHRGRPGAILGDVPFFAEGGYPATAIASRRTRCLVVDRGTLAAAMAADPDLAWRCLENLSRRVRFLVERLDERSRVDVRSRLLGYLERRSEEAGGAWFGLGLTQGDLAEELGTVREVVVRAMSDLKREGLLEADGARYRLKSSRPA